MSKGHETLLNSKLSLGLVAAAAVQSGAGFLNLTDSCMMRQSRDGSTRDKEFEGFQVLWARGQRGQCIRSPCRAVATLNGMPIPKRCRCQLEQGKTQEQPGHRMSCVWHYSDGRFMRDVFEPTAFVVHLAA